MEPPMDPPMPAAQGNDVPCGALGGGEDDGGQRLLDRGDAAPEADQGAAAAGRSTCTSPGGADGAGADVGESVEPAGPAGPPRVSPYSVIDIAPFQEDPGPQAVAEESAGPHVPSGYSVPVPCGYAVPSGLPALLPAYSSPVLVRPASPDGEAETPEVADDSQCNSLSSEDPASRRLAAQQNSWHGGSVGGGPAPLDAGFSIPPVCVAPPQALPCSSSRECVPGPCVSPPGATPERREATACSSRGDPACTEDSALAHWAADPANTAWMDNPEEAIYDDVPRENSDSEPADEMLYDDVENGDEAGNSSLEDGWSSSEFESYGEQSDSECKNGVPRPFLRGGHKKQLSHDLARLKEHYEKKMKELVASTVGSAEMQQLKQKHELKVQKLMRAAREGTKDGLQRTKAAVKRGRSFMRTKPFVSQDAGPGPEEEQDVFIDVDCRHPDAVLAPMPAGLSPQQVVRRCILGSIVDSEKSYIDSLTGILEQYERPLSEMEPKLLSARKLQVVFQRLRAVLQCHRLFQIALASRVAEWDAVEMIGDVFVASFSKSMVLDAYSSYVNNLGAAMAVLRKASATKPAFLAFLKQSQGSSPDSVTLYGLMAKPVQRFPQFILLLQDMLQHTPRGHADRLPLQMALAELETLAEKLLERKRDADQRCEVKQVAKAMNERYLNKLLSSGDRHLIRSDDMIETVYNDRGEVVKTKERRLFMLSDVLMCATATARTAHDSNALAAGSRRYLLKWSVPLGHVEVVEHGGGEAAGEPSAGPTAHAPESLAAVAGAKPHQLCTWPGQLYQDLQSLLHDLNVVGQIAQLVGDLRGNYQNLNQAAAHDWTAALQRLVLRKEEEIRAASCCRLQLQLPGKPDKSGRPAFFTAVFSTFTPAVKDSWVNSLQMAQLALGEENHMGWFCVEDDGNQVRRERHPLLVGHVPVTVAKQQEFKIECAAYNPEPQPPDPSAPARGFLWIGSCTSQMGQIAIVSLQNSNSKVIECFNVESRVLCMVHVPAEGDGQEPSAPAGPEAAARRAPGVPTVCLGTEEGSISVYRSSPGAKKTRLQHFFAPERSPVLSLACTPRGLCAGLVGGAVAVYAKAEDGAWDPEPHAVIKLGVLPVRSLLVTEEALWAASGGQVFVIGVETLGVQSQLEAHQEDGMVVSHMAVAGVGIWTAFTSGSTLRLFHTETLRHLQDVNIATPVHHLLPGHQRLSVTSLLVCHGLLMVGTSLGVIVALPVPRLQGIPKVTGRGMVSYHAHSGPVKFLIAATTAPKADKDKPRASPAAGADPQDADQKDTAPGEGARPCPSQHSPDAVWLGASPGPATHRTGLSSSSGSPEPGSEDGFDLLQAPGPAQARGLSARCTRVSSVLLACGGQGRRRLGRRARQPRPEEQVSSVMVWRVPLLHA
ncbi:rho guanine nucleotide exchange factor 10 isoform X2 [Rousettus aegyptiacus]|uniref:rho guanine nucleotide exchange factor 10 isoform X2 n=1 Tax=Rousettus aegyptiacus TaxID=9407 RepID=UPI00168D1CF4|nr:rho guanine nucleotide exchange factor 10 isoform X2 [Rousettus aegyptiacus]